MSEGPRTRMAGRGFSVAYEDAHLLVVDKPPGLHTAPLRPAESDTLLDRVMTEFPDISRVSGIKPAEPGLLHRLDGETSGLVVFARTEETFASLRDQFSKDRVVKQYHAVSGSFADKPVGEGSMEIESRFAPYGPGRRMVRVVLTEEAGPRLLSKCAPGTYRTRVEAAPLPRGFFLVRATLTRGFRHQVRAHLSFLGYPILGDHLYGVSVPDGRFGRTYLHASGIDLVHPASGKALSVRSELPPEFKAFEVA